MPPTAVIPTGFDQGGVEWFVDLGAADPTYILPACVTLGFLAVTEVGMDGIQMQVQSKTPDWGWVCVDGRTGSTMARFGG